MSGGTMSSTSSRATRTIIRVGDLEPPAAFYTQRAETP